MKEDVGGSSQRALCDLRAVPACCGRGAYYLSNCSTKLLNLRWFLLGNREEQ